MKLAESYVFRRAVCGIPPNSLNKTFANLTKEIDKDDYITSLKASLINKKTYKRFPDDDEFKRELVLKNVYILTSNICGLKVGGTVGELWSDNEKVARDIAGDVMDIQFKLAEKELDREALIKAMVTAFEGDPDHKCMGRSAPVRLDRAIKKADELGLEVPKLREMLEFVK